MKRISIVMPSFNTKKYLKRSIQAFLDQDYENKLLIIVDGKSTDGSHEIISQFEKDNECIKWVKTEDKGLSDAMNIGASHMDDDDLFGFLGTDDILLPGILHKAAEFIHYAPELYGVFFDCYLLYPTGTCYFASHKHQNLSLNSILKEISAVGFQNIYLDAGLVKKFKLNTDVKCAMDFELMLRLAAEGYGRRIVHMAIPSTLNIQDENITNVNWKTSRAEAIKYAKLHGGKTYHYMHGGDSLRAKMRRLKTIKRDFQKFLKKRISLSNNI